MTKQRDNDCESKWKERGENQKRQAEGCLEMMSEMDLAAERQLPSLVSRGAMSCPYYSHAVA